MKMPSAACDYDLVILGGGASGLLLADALLRDGFYKGYRILLIERSPKDSNDRTWCWWEAGAGNFDHLLHRQWDKAVFKNASGKREFLLAPYNYKMLRSAPFYADVYRRISESEHVGLLREEVTGVKDTGEKVCISLPGRKITAARCCSSVRDLGFLHHQKEYPLLQQHFTGWFIETQDPVFEENRVTLMDFSVPQQGNTRFMYVLPESPYRALLEYTLFSPDLLTQDEYEKGIRAYIADAEIGPYRILEKETGNIPMSAYPFHRENSKNLMYIGTAGGWTKGSTGYTFRNAMKNTEKLVAFMKEEHDFRTFKTLNRFDFYDRVFLEVLYHNNDMGAELFGRMFLKGDPAKNLRFLDNKTSFREEISVLRTMPTTLFAKYALKVLF